MCSSILATEIPRNSSHAVPDWSLAKSPRLFDGGYEALSSGLVAGRGIDPWVAYSKSGAAPGAAGRCRRAPLDMSIVYSTRAAVRGSRPECSRAKVPSTHGRGDEDRDSVRAGLKFKLGP